jgi:O-succinylbenzoic acid--CoA ligase
LVPLIGLGERSRYLLSLPLASVGGLAVLVRCALARAAVVLPERGETLAQQLPRGRITHASLVSTQLIRLLGEGGSEAALRGLRCVLLGGSAMPQSALDEARRRRVPIAQGYALTEMTSTVAATHPEEHSGEHSSEATSGRVLPHRSVRITSEGEIEVNGAVRFLGYLEAGTEARAGTATEAPRLAQPFSEGGWFATGDLGALGADGRLRVRGRRGNRFVSGGANVPPEAIEAALLRAPEVLAAAVVPVPNGEFGQRPVAFVTLAPGLALGSRIESELADAVRAELPGFMVPDAFLPMPSAATLEGSQKVDRRALGRIAVEEEKALPKNFVSDSTIS